jgi:Protein of unknown function (DUF2510)
MNTTDVDTNISAVFASVLRSDWKNSVKSTPRPSDVVSACDSVVRAGDGAVTPIDAAIMQALDRVSLDDEDYLPTLFAVRELMTVLATIDTSGSRSELVAFLNRTLPVGVVYDYAIEALGECKDKDPDVLAGLILAATGPCVASRRENLPKLCVLARRFGGRIPLSAEQAVRMVSDLRSNEETLGIINDFADEIPTWPRGHQCSFYWFYGHRVDDVRGRPAALPYFAASVLANPSADSAAWSKFPGVEPSPRKAAELAHAHPLPRNGGGITRATLPPAGWFPDPVGRHHYRYWDGTRWTEHVADEGVVGVDHLPE